VSIDVVGLLCRVSGLQEAMGSRRFVQHGKDDEDGGGILPSSSWARSSEERGWWWDSPESPPRPGCKQACGRARHPPISHLVLLFAALLTLASGVMFSVDGVDMDMFAFAFQLGGVVVVAATFARAAATGSVFLVVYE